MLRSRVNTTDQEVKTNDVVWCNRAWVITHPALIAAGESLFPSCLWACVYGEPLSGHSARKQTDSGAATVMSPHLRHDFSLLIAFSFFSMTSGYLENSERRLDKCSSKKQFTHLVWKNLPCTARQKQFLKCYFRCKEAALTSHWGTPSNILCPAGILSVLFLNKDIKINCGSTLTAFDPPPQRTAFLKKKEKKLL